MSDKRTPDTPEDALDMTAAELALGVLDGDERANAIRRVLAEPGFARDVDRWRGHFAAWFEVWPEVQTRDIFVRIERSLDAPIASLAVMPKRGAARLWPGLAALSSIVAVGLLIVLVTRPLPTPPAPTSPPSAVAPAPAPVLVASIAPEAKGTPVTALYDPNAGALRLTEAALGKADRSAQLWVIAGDGVPHALGLLSTKGTTRFTVAPADRARLAAGAVLAVSIEPIGGSPTALPTGPVVATGVLSRV